MDQNFAIKQELNSQQLQMLQSEMARKEKNAVVAWLLWVFLGGIGGHRFYLGQTGRAIGMICATIFTLGIVGGIWALIDAFFIPGALRKANNEIELEILRQIQSAQPARA